MCRITRSLLLAVTVFVVTPPSAHAAATKRLDDHLTALWTSVLETPSAQNPFGTGGSAYACFDLDGTVAPFAPVSVESCTVETGTWIFVTGSSVECSTFEGNGTTDAELRACARAGDLQAAPTVTIDGRDLAVAAVETPLMTITLPPDNIFGLPAGTQGLSVGHGWVVLLHPLTPGTHMIDIGDSVTTEIIVQPGR
jgi:hypothetical protein